MAPSAAPTLDGLLTQARQLSTSELDQLLAGLIDWRSHLEKSLSTLSEAELEDRVTRWIHPNFQHRYSQLWRAMEEGTLADAELEELEELSDRREWLHAERLRCLDELATRRGTTLETEMNRYSLVSHGDA